jgi:predicted transcriptional regulator
MSRGFFAAAWWRGRRAPGAPFGRLEEEVMSVLWQRGDLAVRDVQRELRRTVAYTTVMTTLDRLFKKGFVNRRREGRAFLYTAAYERHEVQATVTSGLLSDLLAGSSAAATPVLSNLVNVVADQDDRLLDELERLVRDKRAQLRLVRDKRAQPSKEQE